MPLDAVLCDFDGVLRFHDQHVHTRIDRTYGLAPGTVLRTALSPALIGPAVVGEITCEEWEKALVAAFTGMLDSPERAARLVEEFVGVPAWIDERVRDLLASAQRRVPVVLVTNATTRLEEDLDRLGLAHFADEVVNSARVGVAKPDRRIYEIAAERAGAAPERCLFVDDRPENVTAAVTLGMTGVLFREVEDLRVALEAEGWGHRSPVSSS
ncbi:HAD-IA family hydrolase [Streptosporangium sp. DT93]|uniref:HAD-IA family hydrolase n=1 Tax=Streptosporangium sp. DT93 TaxID=3393428 RepID=UPI003CF83E5F